MEDLIHFFEKQTNRKYSIFKYNDQKLKDSHSLVTFNNVTYVIDVEDDNELENISGHTYVLYQHNLDFFTLKNVFHNLYENVSILEYKNFFIVNSSTKLDIDCTTPEIIESETYSSTYIVYLGDLEDSTSLDFKLEILNQTLPIITRSNVANRFIEINDLAIYKTISLVSSDKHFSNLTNLSEIKNMDENLLHTGINFIENDLNISKTSSSLFLHRNTLIYRLEKIKEILGLDLKSFKDALVFYLSIKSYLYSKNI